MSPPWPSGSVAGHCDDFKSACGSVALLSAAFLQIRTLPPVPSQFSFRPKLFASSKLAWDHLARTPVAELVPSRSHEPVPPVSRPTSRSQLSPD